MLETLHGIVPFLEWFETLKNRPSIVAVDARLTRVSDGNFGDHKSVGSGVFELRITKGAGLRVYYALESQKVVVLICGGSKRTQKKDIRKAQILWKEFVNAS